MILSTLLLLVAAPGNCPEAGEAELSSECYLQYLQERFPDVDCEEATTQLEMNVCSGSDFARADIALNEAWSRVRERYRNPDGTGEAWNAILKAQRAWLAYRDADCDVEKIRWRGGSIMPLMVSSCLAGLTEARTSKLECLATEGC